MAAVLAHGPKAVLSHRSAAAHWGIGQPSWKIDIRVLRVTGKRMDSEPGAVLADILALRRVS